jgi:hypothetical protein
MYSKLLYFLAVFHFFLFPVAAAFAQNAEPDTYGYAWDDSEPWTWEDVSDGALGPRGDDILSEPIDLGFPFIFYGHIFHKARISTNGHISFDDATSWDVRCDESEIDIQGYAGLWTDINVSSLGSIFHKTVGEVGARKFIVQYDAVPILDNDNDLATFQIVLEEGGNDILIRIDDPFDSALKRSNLSMRGWEQGEYISSQCAAPAGVSGAAWRFTHPETIGAILSQPRGVAKIVNSDEPQSEYVVDIFNGKSDPINFAAEATGSIWPISLMPESGTIEAGAMQAIRLTVDAFGAGRDSGQRDLTTLGLSGDLTVEYEFTTIFAENFTGTNIDVADLAAQPIVNGIPGEQEYGLGNPIRLENDRQVLAHFSYYDGKLHWLVEDLTSIQESDSDIGFYFDPGADGWNDNGSDGNYWFILEEGETRVVFRPITEIFGHPQYGDLEAAQGVEYAASPFHGYMVHEMAIDVSNFFPSPAEKGVLPCWFYSHNLESGEMADWLGLSEDGRHLDPMEYGTLTHESFEIPSDDDLNDDMDDDDDINDDSNDDSGEDDFDDDSDDSLGDDDVSGGNDDDDDGCGC